MSASNRWTVLLGIGAIAALAFANGCATTDEAKVARGIAQRQALQKVLIARGDEDSLAAGALFEFLNSRIDRTKSADPERSNVAFGLAARAVAAAPERTDLALEQLQLCQEVPSCKSATLEARLLELDPENGISWMYALERAESANDPQSLARARAGMARAQRIDRYWTQSVAHLTAAVSGQAGFNADEALGEVVGLESALMSPLQPVSKACSAQEIQQPEVLAQCRQIAVAFRRADVSLFEMYGTSLGKRLWPAGSAEQAQIVAERRALDYGQELWSRHPFKLSSPSSVRILGTLYARYPTEQQAFRALCIQLGLNPDPPADWIDRATP